MIQPDGATAEEFVLSSEERAEIEHEMSHYEDPRAAAIEALKIVQKHRGWVSDGAIYAIAAVLGITPVDLEGVATFYSLIYRRPVGRHVIKVCDSLTCMLMGYESVLDAIKRQLNIDYGQTTQDGRFTLLPTCCLGNCDKGPSIMVDGNTHSHLDAEKMVQLLEQYK
ncbi:NADH dehydrogenase [Achromatium sp. WMS2]|nr:NADH dehydrogenase [Achromatium sp. WMS2]